jgi:hypothetical protein
MEQCIQCLIYCNNKHRQINQDTLIVAIHFDNWVVLEHDPRVKKFKILGNTPAEIEKYNFIRGRPPPDNDKQSTESHTSDDTNKKIRNSLINSTV